jgi:hypothetical protein
MKLALFERLSWSAATLAAGAVLPATLIYWVASRDMRIPPSETLAIIGDFYSRPFDTLTWSAIWHFPPFALLSIVSFVVSRQGTRRWLMIVVLAGMTLIMIPMVPRSIHSFKDTYRRDNFGEGAEFFHFGTSILSSLSLGAGLLLITAIHRRLPIRRRSQPTPL